MYGRGLAPIFLKNKFFTHDMEVISISLKKNTAKCTLDQSAMFLLQNPVSLRAVHSYEQQENFRNN